MNYIIFDIDGTLTHTKKVEDSSFMKAFEETFAIDIWSQKWEDIVNVTDWGITEEIVLREKGRPPSAQEYSKMKENFVDKLRQEKERDVHQFNEVPGAQEFFDLLRSKDNVGLGIATGSWEASAHLKLEAIGLDIQGVCFSNSDCHKSREAITKDVMHQMRIKYQEPANRIIYFGDGKWDLLTCQKLGIEFIGIDVERDGRLKELGTKCVFEDYSNFNAILNFMEIEKY